ATGMPTQVSYIQNREDLRLLRDPNRELVLLRTRRADGVPYTDPNTVSNGSDPSGYRRPAFSERLGTPEDLLQTLVPLDAVDCRALQYFNDPGPPNNNEGTRHWYMRNTVPVMR